LSILDFVIVFVVVIEVFEVDKSDLLLDYFKRRVDEVVSLKLSSEAVNVVWLLIHSIVTSRFSSSSASCRLYRNDHDRAKFRTASPVRCVQGYCMHSGTVWAHNLDACAHGQI